MELGAAPSLACVTRAHRGEVACLDVQAAGWLATGGGDGALRAWRWRAGEDAGAGWELAAECRRAHRYGATAARWGPAGALLASAGVDGAVRVWVLEAGGEGLACRHALAAAGAAAVRTLCWVEGGGALVAGHDDGAVRVWSADGRPLAVLAGPHAGAVHALTVLADGALLLSACTHGTLKVFDFVALCSSAEEEGEADEAAPLVWIDDAHDLGALCADAAPGTRLAATGGHDARVRVWRAARRDGGAATALVPECSLEGHAGAVTALRWARGGLVLASASLDRSVRLWAPLERTCLLALPAHVRYLTCVALAPDLRYMITGSNDRTCRTWSLGAFSPRDEARTPCDALVHFALGDLEGIGPIEADDEREPAGAGAGAGAGARAGAGGEAQCVWRARSHSGAINCIAAHDDFLATASSDGTVRVWRWAAGAEGAEGEATLTEEHVLAAHNYPALACEFGAGAAAAVLLSAGLDGCAYLWDVQTGVLVRSLCVPGGSGAGGGAGGGVRGARLSREAAPRALLATDDGLAPLWSVARADPQPDWVYAGLAQAATCCAWAGDGRVCAVGGAGGELLLLAPPSPRPLHLEPQAHDLGVTSCDFAPPGASGTPAGGYLLASAGNDSLIKLWTVKLYEEEVDLCGALVLRSEVAAGGCASSVRWGEGALLASAGDDSWARAWCLQEGAAPRLRAAGQVRAPGALCALAVRGGLLAVGAQRGELALWRLAAPPAAHALADALPAPRLWRTHAVVRWLLEHVASAPDGALSREREAALTSAARAVRLTGARMLDEPVEELLEALGFGDRPSVGGEEEEEGQDEDERDVVRHRLREELSWLRAEPPSAQAEAGAPHALLCPLSHRLLRWPTRAADGFTYERENILEWLRAAPPEGAVSPVSGRRLRNTQLAPNYKLLRAVRDYLRGCEQEPDPEPPAD